MSSRPKKASRRNPKEPTTSGRVLPVPIASLLPALLIGGSLFAGGVILFADWWVALPAGAEAQYVGSQSCIQCHQAEGSKWRGSHHDLAMDRASESTVLGDFAGAELEHFGIKSRMFRDGDRFMVHTEGPDGKMSDFEVKYVFGVEPLQQYMVEFDRTAAVADDEIARLQVLRISWDTERKEWFYLSPPDVDESQERLEPDDILHWTGRSQCWNATCADCHSTNLKKNFDVDTKTYHTTFSEIDVGCEACHGPGSLHVQLAEANSLFWDRKLGYGLAKLKDKDPQTEIETCAPCHSHRQAIHPGWAGGKNFHDHFNNSLLHDGLYHPDGQIREEVYVYGSFLQSKMYHKGVRCTDCHDPHTTRLKYEGNKVCTSCHAHPASKYDTTNHHHHQNGSTGASCVDCHMPTTTYMDVDARRDHSIRVPRPELSVALGTPNACSGCHIDRLKLPAEKRGQLDQYADWIQAAQDGDQVIQAELARVDQWCQDAFVRWYGDPPEEDRQYAAIFAQARSDPRGAEDGLCELATKKTAPAIVRATALYHLSSLDSPTSLEVAARSLGDKDPQVRAAALGRFDTEIATLAQRLPLARSQAAAKRLYRPIAESVAKLLHDERRDVRMEAARVLIGVPGSLLSDLLSKDDRQALRDGIEQLQEGLLVNNDHAQAHMVQGSLWELLGNIPKALKEYETALDVEPTVAGPRRNLAALYDQLAQGDDADEMRERSSQLRNQELALLERDARLSPEIAAVQYQYGLMLHAVGQKEQAAEQLIKAYELEPNTPQYAFAVALLYQDRQQWRDALPVAEKLVALRPRDLDYQILLETIRERLNASPAADADTDDNSSDPTTPAQ